MKNIKDYDIRTEVLIKTPIKNMVNMKRISSGKSN